MFKIKHNIMVVKVLAVLLSLLSILVERAGAQQITADTTGMVLGRQINITLELELEKADRVEWPVFSDTITSSIEIIRKSKIDSIANTATGGFTLRQNLLITSFDTGFHVIPPIVFKVFENGSNEFSMHETEPLLISVSGVPVDSNADIKDLKPVMDAPLTFRDFLPWLLGLAGILAIILLIWFYLRSRKSKKPLLKITLRQPKPPHQIALEQLEELKARQLWQKGQVKEYYSGLTDILRDYFEARFGVNALEMTSDEILSSMKNHLSDAQRFNDLQKILVLADMAKFAKARPLGSENELSYTLSTAIVNSTRPTPELKTDKSETTPESSADKKRTED